MTKQVRNANGDRRDMFQLSIVLSETSKTQIYVPSEMANSSIICRVVIFF